ncbi:hypothetical protein IQ270_25915 [Microcoleus sp. LEGE 07076]|uniref:hypothetical protein n=1 Tax=Microcoleus sp. LEGE 07076 TaxID=915322 RepID=UPI0018814B61|nr:hypothetical protein [Microcoleus sp. LEGE 07076]MBE9187984.1 hypothetical protein [Microcoleus sp. LEGE 07076]
MVIARAIDFLAASSIISKPILTSHQKLAEHKILTVILIAEHFLIASTNNSQSSNIK